MLDLRSDFLSRPTPEMVKAMTEAAARRGGFGLREDRDVQALESIAAQMVGKEDALFCASCGMANQIAIHLRCRPGNALVAEATSHVILSEAGGPAALSGVMCRGLPGTDGVLDFSLLDEALSAGDSQRSKADLLVVENTHVRSGGSLISLEASRYLQNAARRHGVPVHLDGSRIFNAAVAMGVMPSEICDTADSVAFSLNKGLAAPLGAILAGSRDFISEAVRVRQMFGGGWRPAGIPAAAARIALLTMPERLVDDHEIASLLGDALTAIEGISLGQKQVWTNLVLIDLDERLCSAIEFATELSHHGVMALPFGKFRLRLAVYYEIKKSDINLIVAAFSKVLEAARSKNSEGNSHG